MRRFKRLFALLFILSLFVGVFHEIDHAHAAGDTCEVCLFAHSPLILSDTVEVSKVDSAAVVFDARITPLRFVSYIPTHSRSPPLFS